jgi:hypothetical protein
MHLVPLAIAQASVLFSRLPQPPPALDRCAETYAVVAYLEHDRGPEVHSVGLIVGLDENGCLVERLPFPTDGRFPENPDVDPEWTQASSQMGYLAYLVFACFMRVNRREAVIDRFSGQWHIG